MSPPYQEKFLKGSRARIVDRVQLEEFLRTWMYHHKLEAFQLEFAGQIAVVASVGFYHGGDVLYSLDGIPGTWHEACLDAAPVRQSAKLAPR